MAAQVAAWKPGVTLADRAAPVDERNGVAATQFRGMAVHAWAAAKTVETAERALERVPFLLMVERGAGMARPDVVEDARGNGLFWAGISWALITSGQNAH